MPIEIDKKKLIQRRNLEKQFGRRRTATFNKAKIEIIVDLAPACTKTAVPVVMVSGWASTAAVLKENIIALAATGRRIIYANAPHGVPAAGQPGYPAAELRKAAALLLTLDARRVRHADVVAHSEGAIVVAIAATLRPEKFRNVILVNPAGLSKIKDIGQLASDFSVDMLWGEIRRLLAEPGLAKTVLTTWLEAGKTIVADPFKAWEEVQAISSAEIAGLLKDLKDRGLGVAVIHAKDDRTFPVEEVCRRARAGEVCEIIVVPGSHNELYLKPEAFAHLINRTLIALESRKK